jgi:hypothetical protein
MSRFTGIAQSLVRTKAILLCIKRFRIHHTALHLRQLSKDEIELPLFVQLELGPDEVLVFRAYAINKEDPILLTKTPGCYVHIKLTPLNLRMSRGSGDSLQPRGSLK